jgi:hypothetical protein
VAVLSGQDGLVALVDGLTQSIDLLEELSQRRLVAYAVYQVALWQCCSQRTPRSNPAQRFIYGVCADRTLTDKEYTEQRAKLGDMAVPCQTSAGFGRFLQAEDERYRALATGLKLE